MPIDVSLSNANLNFRKSKFRIRNDVRSNDDIYSGVDFIRRHSDIQIFIDSMRLVSGAAGDIVAFAPSATFDTRIMRKQFHCNSLAVGSHSLCHSNNRKMVFGRFRLFVIDIYRQQRVNVLHLALVQHDIRSHLAARAVESRKKLLAKPTAWVVYT